MADPLYRQIAEHLRLGIESSELEPGRQLPTEQELGERYKASRNTIRDAVKWLTTRGLVETRHGQGTFVTETIDPFITTLSEDPETGFGGGEGAAYLSEVTAQRRKPDASDTHVEIQRAAGKIAAELRLEEGTPVVSRHQRRFIDDRAWSLQTSFYPMGLVQRGALELIKPANIEPGTVLYLKETLGIEQAGYKDTITVRPASETETTFFKLPDDGRIAVFETFRTAFDKKDGPFRLTRSVFPADRNVFVVNVGDVCADGSNPDQRRSG